MNSDKLETCEDCEYYKAGVNTTFCTNYVNELNVPRIIRNGPQIPSWCPIVKNRRELADKIEESKKKNKEELEEL